MLQGFVGMPRLGFMISCMRGNCGTALRQRLLGKNAGGVHIATGATPSVVGACDQLANLHILGRTEAAQQGNRSVALVRLESRHRLLAVNYPLYLILFESL
jgi:hypothetical protein